MVPTRHGALSYLPVFTWVLPAWCFVLSICLHVGFTWVVLCLIYLSSRGFYLRGADKTRRLVLSTCLHVGFTCVVPIRHGALSHLPLIYLSSRGFYLRGADKTRHCRNDAIYSDHHTPPPPPPFPTAPNTISSRRYFAGDILHDLRPGSSSNMTQFDDLKKQNAAAGAFLSPPPTVRYRRERAAWGRQALADCPVGEALITPVIAGAAAPQCFILPPQFHLLSPVFA